METINENVFTCNSDEINVKEKVYSYDEAFQMTGHGRYNHLCLLACSIISNAVACDMFGFSIVVAASSCDLQLGLTETGILASAPFAGVIFALPWGYFADTRGRRLAILISTIGGFTFATLSSLSPSWQVLLTLKILGSSFLVASYTLTMTYLGESIGDKHRSRYMLAMNCANLSSEIFAFGLAYFILPLSFEITIPWLSITYRSWRLFTFLLSAPISVGALIISFLYESPKFLANNGENAKALNVLRSIHALNNGTKDEYTVHDLKAYGNDDKNPVKLWKSIVDQTVPIFKPPLIKITLRLFYLFIICSCTNNIFLMWFPKIVNLFFNSQAGSNTNDNSFCQNIISNITSNETDSKKMNCDDTISSNTLFSGVFLGSSHTIIGLLAMKFANWRRVILISTFSLSAVSGVLVQVLRQPVLIILALVIMLSTPVGLGVVASYCNDLFPTSYRSLGTSLGLMTARIFSTIGVNVMSSIITSYCSLTFYCWSVFIISGVVMTLLLPSTEKNNIQDIK